MLTRILTDVQDKILAEERTWLGRLQVALARFDVSADDQSILDRSIRQLDQLFLLVIVGEFNAGKSAFINALLGSRLLEEGPTPTTTRINVIKYEHDPSASPVDPAIDVITAPVEILRHINIVDTPGTNAIFREHEAITSEFVPRSDLVLFVTSADRPFTESERGFLTAIRQWGKKVVVVVNKIDILESMEDVARVEEFVRDSSRSLLGAAPEIFSVSARHALRVKSGAATVPVPGNRFEALEEFIAQTLDQREQLRLKLLNPIGVGTRLIDQSLGIIESRLDVLKEDVTTIEDIEGQLAIYREDLGREFRFRLSHVDNVLHSFEKRGIEFFEDTMRLARIFDLLNKSKLRADFERTVVADTPQVIERNVHEAIDWMVATDLRQWHGMTERLQRRRAAHADRIVGDVGGTFNYDRARLLDTVGRAAQDAVESYDKEKESSEMADSVRSAVAGTALAEASALSLGALVTALASTTFADVTGVLAAGTVAVVGLFVIPMRRGQAKKELRAKIARLRETLMSSLNTQFDREVQRSMDRHRESMAPYTRFVRAERERLTTLATELRAVRDGLSALAVRIERL